MLIEAHEENRSFFIVIFDLLVRFVAHVFPAFRI
jgi:hypothetical protein